MTRTSWFASKTKIICTFNTAPPRRSMNTIFTTGVAAKKQGLRIKKTKKKNGERKKKMKNKVRKVFYEFL